MNQIKNLAGQTAVYGMGTIIPKLLHFGFLTPFYTRTFGVEGYGPITELYAYVVILNVIITFGMETGFFRFSQEKSSFKSVFSTATMVVAILATVFLATVLIFESDIAAAIKYQDSPQYIRWFAWIIAIDCMSAIPFAKLRRQNRARYFATLKLVNVVLTIVLVIFFINIWPQFAAKNPNTWFNSMFNPDLGVGYVFLANLFVSAFMYLLLIPEYRSLGGRINKELLSKILRYSAPLVIVGIAGSINEVADKILLKFLFVGENSMNEVGAYGGNFRLAVIMTLFVQMFRYAFEPFLFSQKGKNQGELYAQIMDVFVAIGMLIFLATTLYLDVLIDLFFHDRKEEFAGANGVVPIVLMANLFLGIYYSLSVWYKVTDLTKYAAVMAIGGSVITLVLNAILIPKYSYMGSAWAHLACYTFMMLTSYFWGKKVNPIPYSVMRILELMGIGLALYFLNLFIKEYAPGAFYYLGSSTLITYLIYVNIRLKLLKVLFSKDA